MPQAAHGNLCGVFPSNGRPHIVTGGGLRNYVDERNKTFIFDIDGDQPKWRPGPDYPFPVSKTSSVPFKDTFLVVGGFGIRSGAFYNAIHEFDPLNEKWIRRPEKLAVGKRGVAPVMIGDNVFQCK